MTNYIQSEYLHSTPKIEQSLILFSFFDRLQDLNNVRQVERQTMQNLERRLTEERRLRQSLEAQLNNERKYRKQAEEKAAR